MAVKKAFQERAVGSVSPSKNERVDARAFGEQSNHQSGQSILEFLVTLPLMLGLVMLMIRVNTYIQMGVVNQQYARAQTLFVSGNGAEYPQRPLVITNLAKARYNQFVVAISDNEQSLDADPNTPQLATTYHIVPPGAPVGNDNAQTEATQRGNLRVRSSVTLCLPMLVSGGTPLRPINGFIQPGAAAGPGTSAQQFVYCSAPQPYDNDDGGQETI
jgi:hypothetical protein